MIHVIYIQDGDYDDIHDDDYVNIQDDVEDEFDDDGCLYRHDDIEDEFANYDNDDVDDFFF